VRIKRGFDYRIIFTAIYIAVAGYCFALGLKPAGATRHENISAYIGIPSIGLMSSVESLSLQDNRLITPDVVAGSFARENSSRTFLVGHSTTVFSELKNLVIGDVIVYNGIPYRVDSTEVVEKSTINMNKLVRGDLDADKTLAIMTCAGELYENGDASHRLIVIATEISL